jgi:hypothetical protein
MNAWLAKTVKGSPPQRQRSLSPTVSRFKVVADAPPSALLRRPPFGFRSFPSGF